ncbi:MAG: hypothetical protein KAS04_00680 [Candidatus Aenigmarchaeota archaeon]|nr:hypothetical protein [Candidatus Aenigmarchaeota archaeon]
MASYTKVRVEGKERYKMANGVYPRGRGTWAFDIGGDTFWPGHGMTYSSAKEEAQKEAVIRGVHVIKVLT